ncbi:hemopexin repeat-containing protein [Streptosporangium sp. NPDC000396]|uniref:hemopexin repeat-containing protein n=1 Tax=Streptosporangium sp. NPDC000396 TaxID=3366185 RepID=UPI00368B17D9
MPTEVVDAFFSVTGSGSKVGFVVQGGRAARFGWAQVRMLDHYAPVLGKWWPALPAAFAVGFDAALAVPADDPWTVVFRGDQCLRLHPVNGSVGQVGPIDGLYPGLPTGFRAGIDAALPSAAAGEAYFFKGGQCVRYDLRSSAPIETKSLADTWQGLRDKAPAFVNGIAAAVLDPVTGKAFFFKGSEFVRVALGTRTVETNAAAVNDTTWPGLRRAFSPGRAYVARRPENDSDRSVNVVDLASRTVTETLDIFLNDDAQRSISTTPDGRFLYLATDPAITCVDTADHRTVATFQGRTTGPEPGYAYSPDGTHCHFISYDGSPHLETVRAGTFSGVSRIRLSGQAFATGTVTADDSGRGVVIMDSASRIAPKQDGRLVYVGGRLPDYSVVVAEVDLEQKLVRQFFPLPGTSSVEDLVLSPDGAVAHVGSYDLTLAFSTRTGEILRQKILPGCQALALTPDGSSLFCLPSAEGEGVLIADPATHRVQDRIPIEASGGRGTGRGIAFSHGGAFAYVAEASEEGGFSLAVIDVEAREKIASIPLPGSNRVHWVTFAPV